MEQEQDEDVAEAMPTSLFPIAGGAQFGSLFQVREEQASAQQANDWLTNLSFSETLLPARSSPVRLEQNAAPTTESDDFSDQEVEAKKKRKKKSSREERHQRKKHKKQRDKELAEDSAIGALKGKTHRKASGDHWAAQPGQDKKPYYFESRGDRDNLAFGCLFRQDVPRYFSYQSKELLSEGLIWKNRVDFLTPEADSLVQDEDLKTGGRYWSIKVASLERRHDVKRLKLWSDRSARQPLVGTFVPLEADADDKASLRPHEESWDEYVLRKTKEFNQLTHEQPQNKDAWISFADFQDELIKAAQKKAPRLHAIDKKIHLLTKAMELDPDDEDLILLYLNTCKRTEDIPALVSKWERTILKHSGSYRLWREYLNLCRSTFSSFSVSAIRKQYSQALQALIAARNRQHREDDQKSSGSLSSELAKAEKAIVTIFCDLCRFEWQSGHHELAIGLLQAQFEYSMLCPSIQLSAKHKLKLFEAFWNSGAPRIGEPGAVGWSIWMEREEEELQKARAATSHKEEDDGGWKGWSTASQAAEGEVSQVAATSNDNEPQADQKAEEDTEIDNETSLEEDDAALLEKLGLNLDTKEIEVKDARTWKRWSEEEDRRDVEQWLPVKPTSTVLRVAGDDDENTREEDEELQKMVLFDDIREFLFSLWTVDARRHFIGEFSEFCNAPLYDWSCSNARGYKEQIDSMDVLKTKFLASFEDQSLEFLVPAVDWIKESTGRLQFVRNAFLLLKDFMARKLHFQEVLLSLEAMEASEKDGTCNGARTLAKNLLKMNREDLTLWAAYASFEASTGKVEVARKVFDNALKSLPKESQPDAPILYLAYAELEMAQCSASGENSGQRVLYILYYLGSGEPFTPAGTSSSLSPTQVLKGRRGFSDQLQKLRQLCQREDLSEAGACLVICAALFEQLSAGWQAAAAIFEDSIKMGSPERRRPNMHYERLYVCYVSMLESQKNLVKPAYIRRIVKQGLFQYPFNLKLLNLYVHSSTANETRLLIDELSKRHPSSLHWLFTLSWELSKPGSGSHIHGLFERALEAGGSQSALLWRCYISFELKSNNLDNARRVFFRGIHACPWSKALWMDGFHKLTSIVSVKELSDLVDIMRDKELRIRTDVYEILLEEAEVS